MGAKLDLEKDLQFGTLNDLKDVNVSNSGDRRRTSSLSAINSLIRNTYTPDSLREITSLQGIVVSKRQISAPRYSNRESLLNAFLTTTGDAPDDDITGNPEIPQTNNQTMYKVYIS